MPRRHPMQGIITDGLDTTAPDPQNPRQKQAPLPTKKGPALTEKEKVQPAKGEASEA